VKDTLFGDTGAGPLAL